MLTLLEGQISFGGMHDVLDGVYRHKNVTNGVLRITSNGGSGFIGVFCGRFLTGAVLTLTGESGYHALTRLLSAKDGSYSFMDAQKEVLPDLRQSLGVDISALLAAVDWATSELPLSEETLTGLKTRISTEEFQLFDTSVDLEHEHKIDEKSRIERITKTYDQLLCYSAYQQSQNANTSALAQQRGARGKGTNQFTPTMPLPHPMSLHAATKDQAPEQGGSSARNSQYNRLKGWSMSDRGTILGTIIALLLVFVVCYALVALGPHLLHR